MKILYIIGNGLDIALKMKTSYQDFFKYYLALPSTDKDILAMKEDIKSHKYETWADLEMGLGSYSSKCVNKDIFLRCLTDIKGNLKEYLQKESQKIWDYRISSMSSFIAPGQFLDPEPRARYNSFRNRKGIDVYIDIITFNYTDTLEYLFVFNNQSVKLHASSPSAVLRSIQHIHGTLDNMMVMGVNDSSQISNTAFNTDLDVVEDFIKPEFNDACMNNKNSVCESMIMDAEMIVLYGSSLGFTDSKWWKLIGKRMESGNYPLLIYLPYDKNKNQSAAPNRIRRWTLEYVHEIRNLFDIKIDEDTLASRMCIALNKRLLSIAKVEKNLNNTK
jgi:hypothetical protein